MRMLIKHSQNVFLLAGSTVFYCFIILLPTIPTIFDEILVRDLGFFNSVVRACFYNLSLLAEMKPFLPNSDFERAFHTFILSRSDFCNSLYILASPLHPQHDYKQYRMRGEASEESKETQIYHSIICLFTLASSPFQN